MITFLKSVQYPVASPSSSMMHGNTLRKCLIYLLHLLTFTVFQKFLIPCTSSSLFLGFTSRLINSFISCHKFSMGLASGDSGGVTHQILGELPTRFWGSYPPDSGGVTHQILGELPTRFWGSYPPDSGGVTHQFMLLLLINSQA